MSANGVPGVADDVGSVPVACRRFPATPAAAAGARGWAGVQLATFGLPDVVLDDVALVLGELVSNVVTHTHVRTFLVSLRVDQSVTVIVEDDERAVPSVRTAVDGDVSGRGLRIVEALTLAWGVTTTREGKAVWARLRRAA